MNERVMNLYRNGISYIEIANQTGLHLTKVNDIISKSKSYNMIFPNVLEKDLFVINKVTDIIRKAGI